MTFTVSAASAVSRFGPFERANRGSSKPHSRTSSYGATRMRSAAQKPVSSCPALTDDEASIAALTRAEIIKLTGMSMEDAVYLRAHVHQAGSAAAG